MHAQFDDAVTAFRNMRIVRDLYQDDAMAQAYAATYIDACTTGPVDVICGVCDLTIEGSAVEDAYLDHGWDQPEFEE